MWPAFLLSSPPPPPRGGGGGRPPGLISICMWIWVYVRVDVDVGVGVHALYVRGAWIWGHGGGRRNNGRLFVAEDIFAGSVRSGMFSQKGGEGRGLCVCMWICMWIWVCVRVDVGVGVGVHVCSVCAGCVDMRARGRATE